MNTVGVVLNWISLAIRAYNWLIIIDAVLSWIPSVNPNSAWVRTLRSFTSIVLNPIRRLIPPERTGFIDLSPLIAILLLSVIASILENIAVHYYR